MKIALVSPYDFAYPGGVVNHISCLERQLTMLGHQVRIIAPASKAVYTYGERFIHIGTPRPVPASGSIARVTVSVRLASQIHAAFDREQFDICHLHEPLMPTLCTTTLRLKRVPMVGTFHACGGKPWYNFSTPLGVMYLKRWFKKLDGHIAVSPVARQFIQSYFPAGYEIIPNGIDASHFSPDAPPLEEFDDGKLNILFVGRMEKRKGVNYLLEAYNILKRKLPETRLIIVGPGLRLRRKYQKYVDDNGLRDVAFVGYANYADLPRYYAVADIACFPATNSESFGIVLLEAMASGKSIVATDIEGYAGVITPGDEGLLVPPRDAATLASSLITLLQDEPLRRRMGAAGRQKALQYDWCHVAQRVLNHYNRVLDGNLLDERQLECAVP
ncbi:MAG: glycosyltransferase family 4 protein [Chloroflexi bacterium]|nr:glycosyltransferase family 4 protein [Chloroflexota bacterium]